MTYRNCRTAAGPTGYGTLRREAGAGTGSLYAFVSETGYGSRDGTGYAPVIDAAIFASGSAYIEKGRGKLDPSESNHTIFCEAALPHLLAWEQRFLQHCPPPFI